MFLAESLNQFDLKPFWIQLTRISLDRYIILYDNLSIKWILHGNYWLHLWVTCHGFCIRKHDSKIFLSSNLTKKFSCKSKIVNSHLIHNEWKIMGVLFKIMLKHCLKYQSFVTLIPLIWHWNWNWNPWNWNWNWNWKPEINFLQLLLQHLLVYQPFPNLGGHNLSCGWFIMQQVCLLSSWDIGPLWCGHKRLWGGYLVPLE